MAKISAVCLSPTIQRTITFKQFIPEKVNRSEYYRMDASGKAVNSVRVLNQLSSGCADVICPLGKDNAQRFLELCEKEGLTKAGVHYVLIPGATRECWTLLDRTAKTTTELVVSEPAIKADVSLQTSEILAEVEKALQTSDALLLAGSRPEIWPSDFSAVICKKGKDCKKIVMADFWGKDLQKTLEICTPDIIKINEEEFCGTFNYSFPLKEAELQAAVCEQSKKLSNIIVVTRGIKSTFAADRGKFYSVPVEKIEKVVNTTACGDSFSAGFLYEYLESRDVEKSLLKGTWCAARNAELECPGAIQA